MVVALINTNMVTLTLVIIRMAVGRVGAHMPVETGQGKVTEVCVSGSMSAG